MEDLQSYIQYDPREVYPGHVDEEPIELQEFICGGVCGKKIYAEPPAPKTTSFGSMYSPLVLCSSCQQIGREAINQIGASLRGGLKL